MQTFVVANQIIRSKSRNTVVTNKNWFTVDYCTAFLYCIVFNSSRRLYISSIKSHQAWRLIYSNQKAYVGWDIKNVMSWFLYHILIENKKINKNHQVINDYCQQIAPCLNTSISSLINFPESFVPAVCNIPSWHQRLIFYLTSNLEIEVKQHIPNSYSRWSMERGV